MDRYQRTMLYNEKGHIMSTWSKVEQCPAGLGFGTSTFKDVSGNPKKFKVALKHYLLTHSFYNLDEFFSEQNA